MEKLGIVELNGNKYCFKCRSFIRNNEEYKIVNQCDLQLGDKILSVGEVNFIEQPSFENYEFETVLYSAIKNFNNSEYYRLEKEFLLKRNRQKMTSKLKKEFLESFNNIPLIRDMKEMWDTKLNNLIWN